MKNDWLISIRLTAITLVLFGVMYPMFIVGVSKVIAPNNGKGTVVLLNGKTIGYEVIGQKFDRPRYFQGRPSAVAYNAASTGGSNKGPSNPEYLQTVRARIDTFLVHNPSIRREEIPVDLITASGSGLDPHISVQAAIIQIPRIAAVRGIPEAQLKELVEQHTEKPFLGIFGPSKINVLKLNVALEQQ